MVARLAWQMPSRRTRRTARAYVAHRSRHLTPEMITQYRDEGYFVLESVLTPAELELIRSGAQYSVERLDAQMSDEGVDRLGINARGKRYFSAMVYAER